MLKKLNTLSSELKFTNPYWEYKFDKYELPNGEIGNYHYINSRGATLVIPVCDDGSIVMLRQFRYLNQMASIEFPGGGIKEGNTPEKNAYEELKEETGFIAGKLKSIGFFNPYNGVTNEICNVYLAEKLTESEAKPEDTEEFEILFLNKQQMIELIKKGEIWDGMTLAAWSLYCCL
ncbi:MAG: nudF [Ignavibacteria bacterium]|nr:nudF [Ignavibacteria bacterium]